jgi:hypothetical protein
MYCIYTIKYYSVFKKKKMLSFAITWMELETIISEISHAQKDKCTCTHLYVEYKTIEFRRSEYNGGYQRQRAGRMRR